MVQTLCLLMLVGSVTLQYYYMGPGFGGREATVWKVCAWRIRSKLIFLLKAKHIMHEFPSHTLKFFVHRRKLGRQI